MTPAIKDFLYLKKEYDRWYENEYKAILSTYDEDEKVYFRKHPHLPLLKVVIPSDENYGAEIDRNDEPSLIEVRKVHSDRK